MHLGFPSPFLWLNYPVTSAGLFLSALGILIVKLKKGIALERWQSGVLLIAFLSQLPLLLVFYTVDARYSLFSLPVIALSSAWLFSDLSKKFSVNHAAVALVVLLGLHLVQQLPLAKQLVGNNLLHRSQAWQYQSIKHIDTFFSSISQDNFLLITALPPHLVDAYAERDLPLLPLSPDQEFLQKSELVWGKNLHYDDLHTEFRNQLKEGKTLFITNAYVTHQHSVIQDFENIKENFELELVSEGCEGACTIYLITLHDENTPPSHSTPPQN